MRLIAVILLFSACLYSCSKEQYTADTIEGKWNITDIKRGEKFIDGAKETHKIEFWKCENAYTASCKGVYSIDYTDSLVKDISDTFKYDIKAEELAITNSQNNKIKDLIRRRFTLKTVKENELLLVPVDSTGNYIKAQR